MVKFYIRWTRLVALFAFVATLVVTTAIYWRLTYYRVWLTSTSPSGKYTVELTGDKGRGGLVTYAVVKYNLLVDGTPLTRNRLAHYGDAMDISFELAYPEYAWVDEKALRFWSNAHRREDNLDTLLISNDTAKTIKFLRIKAWDMFFVFDIPPYSKHQLAFKHMTGSKIVTAEGEFEDGSQIDYSASFSHHKRREALVYCLTFDYDRMTGVKVGRMTQKPPFPCEMTHLTGQFNR
ncbi:MAG TPA: hypothetical protein VFY67_11675 [Pyrinomonadaceae bacterium]|nr:hypothetical protein [Pyrinomonadaceae bacterium]